MAGARDARPVDACRRGWGWRFARRGRGFWAGAPGGSPVQRRQSAVGRRSQRSQGADRVLELEFGQTDPNAQMLVRADELQYDNTNNRILAVGNVQIYYKGSTLEADKVVYEQKTKRMRAEGNARLTEADGKVSRRDHRPDRPVPRRLRRFAAARSRRQDALRRAARGAKGRALHDLPERRLHGLRAVQGRSAQAAALAGARDAHHPRRHREDDLLRGRAARGLRLPAVLLAVSLDARPDGQAQDRLLIPKFGYSSSASARTTRRPRTSGRSRRTTT
jgi:hypothetical protein